MSYLIPAALAAIVLAGWACQYKPSPKPQPPAIRWGQHRKRRIKQ